MFRRWLYDIYIILEATTIDHIRGSEQVDWTIIERGGIRPRLLGVTVESLSSGEIGTRHWTGEQRAAAAITRYRHLRVYLCKRCQLADTWRDFQMARLGCFIGEPFYI